VGFLFFGKEVSLDDLNIKEMREESSKLQVHRRRYGNEMTKAQDERESILRAAREPGVSEGQKENAGYDMNQADRAATRARSKLQDSIEKLNFLSGLIDIAEAAEELKKSGLWKQLNDMGDELPGLLIKVKAGENENRDFISSLSDILEDDAVSVTSRRPRGVNQAMDEINAPDPE